MTAHLYDVLSQKCSHSNNDNRNNNNRFTERKGKEDGICVAPYSTHAYSQSAQAWITQFYLQTAPCLPFLRKRSPAGATTTDAADIPIAAYYSFIDPERMKG